VPANNNFNPFYDSFPEVDVSLAIPSYKFLDPLNKVDLQRVQLYIGAKSQLSRNWELHSYLGYGYSNGQLQKDDFLKDATMSFLNTSTLPNGEIVCSGITSSQSCDPLNLFSESVLLDGELPADFISATKIKSEQSTQYRTSTASFTATGTYFPNSARPVDAAMGINYRKRSIHDRFDNDYSQGNIVGAGERYPTIGANSTFETFTEFQFPIRPPSEKGGEILGNLALRYGDHESFGSSTTYRGIISWQPLASLRLNLSQGSSYRAPALYEQFLSPNSVYTVSRVNIDPCKQYQQIFEPSDQIYINCENQTLPPDFSDYIAYVETTWQGAPDLKAETSLSRNLSMIFNPEHISAEIKIDLYNTSVNNTISELSLSSIGFECYKSEGLTSPFCDRLGPRDPFGELTSVDISYVNIGEQTFNGADIEATTEHSWGQWQLNTFTNLSYLEEYTESILGTLNDYTGHFAYPRWRGYQDLIFNHKNINILWRTSWIGESEEDPVYDPETEDIDRRFAIGQFFTGTLALQYESKNWQYNATVKNIFDREPPIIPTGLTSAIAPREFNTVLGGGYPLFGRTFVLRISHSF